MNDTQSDTQYCFKVDLNRAGSDLRGVALLGHQTLTELHEAIASEPTTDGDSSFSFHFQNAQINNNTCLDDLNLDVGQTIDYVIESLNQKRQRTITLEFIDG